MSVDNPEGWHLKREIQVGHILTTLAVVVSTIAYVSHMEQRIALIEQEVVQLQRTNDQQDRTTAEAIALVRSDLRDIAAKLDRIIESKVAK